MRRVETHQDLVAKGEQLFTNCVACHGEQGEGKPGLGPRLNSDSFLAAASDDFLLETIARGREGTTMVAWGQQMSDMDLYSLVAYMRTLNPVPPADLDRSPLDGDPARGERVFSDICAGCHGDEGGGYSEVPNGTGIGRAAFLDTASNGFLRYIITNGKSLTKMRGFHEDLPTAVADLTPQEVDDVIAYLRSQAW